MTEIKFWITASDCGDVSVTAIFCWCFKHTFTVLALPIKTRSQGECHRFTGKQHMHACTKPDVGLCCWCVMRGAKAEWCDCSQCCIARLPVWGIRQLHCSGSSMLGEGRRQNKGLVRKGRSGLIESFGSSLHWSETCYRDPVSWFPNNEISEKGFVVLWDSILTFLCFLWFSLGCLPLCSSVLNLITITIWKHCGWAQQVVFTYKALQGCCAVNANMLFDAYSVDSLLELMSAHTWLEHVWLPYGYSAHDADSPEQSHHLWPLKKAVTQVEGSKLRVFVRRQHKSWYHYTDLLSRWFNIDGDLEESTYVWCWQSLI